MSNKNPAGALTRLNPEWGSKARKEYDHLKGVNHQADRQTIAEQLDDFVAERREEDMLDYVMVDGITYVYVEPDPEHVWDERAFELWTEL